MPGGGGNLVSALLKSNCPVTGQPDWATVSLRYRGPKIDRAGLLRYLVSYREHAEFHEQCVERIFSEVSARCQPQWLEVEARYPSWRPGHQPWRASPGIAAPVRPTANCGSNRHRRLPLRRAMPGERRPAAGTTMIRRWLRVEPALAGNRQGRIPHSRPAAGTSVHSPIVQPPRGGFASAPSPFNNLHGTVRIT
jgi:hypothetical protein